MDMKQGDLENVVLNGLWDLEDAGAAKSYVGDVQKNIQATGKTWAYTTVKTVLDRLVDKQQVMRQKEGKKYWYTPVVKRETAGLTAVRKLLRQYFKNDINSLTQCIDNLNDPANVEAPAPVKRQTRTGTLAASKPRRETEKSGTKRYGTSQSV